MASFSTANGKTTATFSYTAGTAKVQEIVGLLAEYVWVEQEDEEGNIVNPFSDATNQEKLDVVDTYIRRTLVNQANRYKQQKAEQEAISALTPLDFD